ncbi:MAG: S8 family serine peptidase [Clostridia bacterium]|nr:S8 family serine peptidase [Clostridia bacterium]
MKKTRLKKTAVLTLFWAALMLIVFSISASAAKGDYIVKYNENAVRLMGEQSEPFDVVSEEEMKRLAEAGLLKWYEEDGEMTLLDDMQTYNYPADKWDFPMINADAAFERGYLGQGVRVGVIDSGVNAHEDLADSLKRGHCYMENGSPTDTADEYGHGTSVAGLIAGSGKNGYIGAAPKAEIVPLKVTDGKPVAVSTVCRAIYGGIDDFNCDILNMSLGIKVESEALKEAVEHAEEQGVLLVSAVGNNGSRAKLYPAAYDSVIGVGAVDETEEIYYHSNHNESVFITAPGVNVKTLGRFSGYELKSGTSFAVPFVTAAAAVMLSIDGALTPRDIMRILSETAADKGDNGYDEYYGAGILQIGGCVTKLLNRKLRFLPETGAASQIQNLTDTDLSCRYMMAEYGENGVCTGVTACDLTIPANGTAEIEAPKENAQYGQFVFKTDKLEPLASARKSR